MLPFSLLPVMGLPSGLPDKSLIKEMAGINDQNEQHG
jgi:hypothetical protein